MAGKTIKRPTRSSLKNGFAEIAASAFHRSFDESFKWCAQVNPRGSTRTAIAYWLEAMRGRLEWYEEKERQRLQQRPTKPSSRPVGVSAT